MTDYRKLLDLLLQHDVKFIVVGGVAAIVHGSSQATYDLDVVYARDKSNLQSLVDCLGPFQPYLRGAPPGLPFQFDLPTLRNGLNFTLTTTLGDIDLIGEITGTGSYAALLPLSDSLNVMGAQCMCVRLEELIHLKKSAGRPKDLQALAELRSIAQERANKPRTDAQ